MTAAAPVEPHASDSGSCSPAPPPDRLRDTVRHMLGAHVLDREAFRFLRARARAHWRVLALSGAVTLVMAGLAGAIAWMVKNVTQSLLDRSPLREPALWAAAALAAGLARSGLEVCNRIALSTVLARIIQQIRLEVFRGLQDNSLAFYTRVRTGELASLIGNDACSAAAGVAGVFTLFLEGPATAVVLLVVMLCLNVWLTLVALALIPALAWCVARISRRARSAQWHLYDQQSELTALMVESIVNTRQVKAYGLQSSQVAEFSRRGDAVVARARHAAILVALVSPVSEAISTLGIVAMVVLAYYQIQNGWTTPGAVAGCLVAALTLKRPLRDFSESVVHLQGAFAAARRLLWAMEHGQESSGCAEFSEPFHALALDRVSFSYDGKRNILTDVSTECRRGQRVAIVGVSGAGKSTLLDLVTGFYPCSAGRILVNGRDLAGIRLNAWRRQIGFVSQEPMLFDVSVAENIRYGNPDASPEQVADAARRAGCDEMLLHLPEGMATRVGERGCRLSGGERKRVALARALVRPISLLVLDEATGDLDLETEERILSVVDGLASELLVLNVSHRPSILKHSDRCLRIEDGRIREVSLDPAGGVAENAA